LAIGIALLYLWNFIRGRHEVATYWLWERALTRRPAWFRLRFWLSLATQIVILLLLVAALAEPYWQAAVAGRRTLVLVLDASASMSATDVKPSRLAAAQAEAKRIVQGLQPGERMAILSAGSLVRIACRMTGEPQALQAAIDGISPTDGSTHMQEAVELARRVLDGRPNPHIILLTDGCFPQAEAVARDEEVYLKRFGSGGRNFAVTRLSVRPDPHDPAQQLVMVETANHSASSAKVPLGVVVERGKPQTAAVELAAGAVAETSLSVPVETSGMLSVQLTVNDDLAADNQARVRVTSRRRPNVLLVSAAPSAAADAVRTTLQALAGIDLQVVEQLPVTLPPQLVVVLHGQVPSSLPACPLLVITPQGSCDLWDTAGTVPEGQCAVESVRRDLPLLAGVRFEDVVVEEAVKLQFKHPAQTLVAASSGDPLYSLVQRPAGPVLVLQVDLRKDKSDLALRSDFPRLIEQAVRRLTGTADSVTLAAGSDEPVAKLGIDEPSPPTPVNVVSDVESDIRAGANVPSRDVLSPAPTREQPLWMLLAGLAVVLLLIEWCLFHRRVVV
jgi:hypothetical protein